MRSPISHAAKLVLGLTLTVIALPLSTLATASNFSLSLGKVDVEWASRLASSPPDEAGSSSGAPSTSASTLRQLQARGGRYRLLLVSAPFTVACDEGRGKEVGEETDGEDGEEGNDCGAATISVSSVVALSRDPVLDARDAGPAAAAGTDISTPLPSCASVAEAAARDVQGGATDDGLALLSSWFRPSKPEASECCRGDNATECDFFPPQLAWQEAFSATASSSAPPPVGDAGDWALGTFPWVLCSLGGGRRDGLSYPNNPTKPAAR